MKIISLSSKNKSGITLVEILVALSVASLIMLPIILLFGINEKITYKSINEVVACNLALQKIEELKSRQFSDLRKLIELDGGSVTDGPFREVLLVTEKNANWNTPGVDYTREARLAFYPNINPDASRPDFELQKRRIRIRVNVLFTERVSGQKDQVKNFELATILGDETLGSGMNASFSATIGG